MLKFKGQTELGNWLKFNITQIGGVAGDYIAVYIHPDYTVFVNPDTIQLADDHRKIECPFCGKSWIGFKHVPEDHYKNAVNDAIYKIEHLEAGPPVELYQKGYYSAVIEVLKILDEMEAKL